MRYTVIALIATAAVPLAACGSSSTTSTPSTAAPGTSSTSPTTSTNTPNAKPRDHVSGLVASVSGSAIQVTQRNGSATVDFTDATKVSEVDPAQLSDVTAGSCISVRPTKGSQSNEPVTAQTVVVSPANNGQCPGPHGNQNGRGVRGAVASVNGNTIAVSQGGSTVNVTVTSDTIFAKRAASSIQAVAQGKCINATGTKDSSGTLQAAAITVRPAGNQPCGGGPRR